MRDRKKREVNYTFLSNVFVWTVITLAVIFFMMITFLFRTGTSIRVVDFNATGQVINTSKSNITKIGVSVDPDKLTFGIVPIGGNVTRELKLEAPSQAKMTKVRIYSVGNITKWLVIPRPTIKLSPNGSLSVPIKFIGLQEGNYTGKIYVVVCTPRYKLAEKFLDVLCDDAFEKWEEEHIKFS